MTAQRVRVSHNGDISFYEDTGTTPKFFWDASAESLGIGTTSPTGDGTALHIHGSSASTLHLTNSTTGSAISDGFDIVTDGLDALLRNRESGAIKFRIGSSEAMRIDSAGRVGIGTSSPSEALEVNGKVKADTHFTSSDSNATLSTSGNGGTVYLRPNGSSTTTGQVIVDNQAVWVLVLVVQPLR